MILQDEFKSNGYLNLLDSANIIDDEINLEDLFDIDDKNNKVKKIKRIQA